MSDGQAQVATFRAFVGDLPEGAEEGGALDEAVKKNGSSFKGRRSERKSGSDDAAERKESVGRPNAVFIRRLPRETDMEEVKAIASKYGDVTSVKANRRFRGATVVFADEEAANKAVQGLDNTEFKDQTITAEKERRTVRSKSRSASKENGTRSRRRRRAGSKDRSETKEDGASPSRRRRQRRPRRVVENDPRAVFIGKFEEAVTEEAVRSALSGAGAISSVRVPPAGTYAYVYFENEGDAAKAVDTFNGKNVLGATVTVERQNRPGSRKELTFEEPAVWVGNLARGVGEEAVRDFFAKYGAIANVSVIEGYASAEKALEANGQELQGRTLKVETPSKSA
ncbi:PABPC4L [Symbiodinium sp. KB8]|nr:PABPC4L [Symbiodinium sp. KB8]